MEYSHKLRQKRHKRIRSTVMGTADRPRLSIYRGLKHLHVQLIDDAAHATLIGLADNGIDAKGTGLARAKALAEALATKAKEKGITKVVFDRGGFRYHGQIKVVADTLRESGVTI